MEKLYRSSPFTEDQLEAFLVNHNSKLTAELVPVFKTWLDEERQKAVKPPASSLSGTRGSVSTAGKKRSSMPSGVGAALGLKSAVEPSSKDVEPAAPDEKRRREAADDAALDGNTGGEAVTEPEAVLCIELLGDAALWTGRPSEAYQWMDEALQDRIIERSQRLLRWQEQLVDTMRRRHPSDEDFVAGVVGEISQAEVILCGRIVCESLEGKLNEKSILLEAPGAGDRPPTRVLLNTGGCKSIVAFAGQIVSVLGRSGVNSVFHAHDFVSGLPLPEPRTISRPAAGDTGDLSFFALCGPFCLRDSLDFSPLEQALERAAASRPHVLFLLGPLLDAGNQCVSSGVARGAGEEEASEAFEDVYREVVLPVLLRSLAALRRVSPHTQVLLSPSLEDVLCFHPLPQPPLDAMLRPVLGPKPLEQLRGVRFLPNPAFLSIAGMTVAVTSADALSPVIRSGMVLRPEAGRLEAGMRVLLEQRCLFPVLPRDPPQVAEKRAAALDFPSDCVPDLCIFPSQAGTAGVTHVDGTAFVNPAVVCRPAALGSCIELRLRSGSTGFLRDLLDVSVHKLA